MLKSKTIMLGAGVILTIAASLFYVACRKEQNTNQGGTTFAGTIPFIPPLKPGDTPGRVTFVITPTNDGNVNLSAQFANGTPGLNVFCSFTIGSYADPSTFIPGYSSTGVLDASGSTTINFNQIRCTLYNAVSFVSFVAFSCSTLQVPAIETTYVNGPEFDFTCLF